MTDNTIPVFSILKDLPKKRKTNFKISPNSSFDCFVGLGITATIGVLVGYAGIGAKIGIDNVKHPTEHLHDIKMTNQQLGICPDDFIQKYSFTAKDSKGQSVEGAECESMDLVPWKVRATKRI